MTRLLTLVANSAKAPEARDNAPPGSPILPRLRPIDRLREFATSVTVGSTPNWTRPPGGGDQGRRRGSHPTRPDSLRPPGSHHAPAQERRPLVPGHRRATSD